MTIRSPFGPPLRPGFAAHAQRLAVVDARRELHHQLVAAAHLALALAAAARGADDPAGAAAIRTGRRGLHGHAHEILLRAHGARSLQRGQVSALVPGAAPLPWHWSQSSTRETVTSFSAPKAASSNVSSTRAPMSSPCMGALALRRVLRPPPKKAAENIAEVAEIAESCPAEPAAARIRVEIRVDTREAVLIVARALYPDRRAPRWPR